MKARNWRTSLGGAVGVFGTTLIGAALLATIAGTNATYRKMVFITAFAGVILSATGKAITAWYAADAKELEKLKQSYDTDHFSKGVEADK